MPADQTKTKNIPHGLLANKRILSLIFILKVFITYILTNTICRSIQQDSTISTQPLQANIIFTNLRSDDENLSTFRHFSPPTVIVCSQTWKISFLSTYLVWAFFDYMVQPKHLTWTLHSLLVLQIAEILRLTNIVCGSF